MNACLFKRPAKGPRLLSATFTVALLALLFAANANATTRYFLGIGNALGYSNEVPLKWAQSDAKKMRSVFVDLGGVHEERAFLLENPNVIALERALSKLQGSVEEAVRQGERTEVIVHYAGHGDRDALHMGGQSFSIALLKKRVAQLGAQASIVIIDACRTDARARGATLGPRFDGAAVREVAPDGTVLLFSAREGEVAQESDTIEGAFFTHALISALRGAADSDGDKRVTLAEAWQNAHARTLTKTHAQASAQHPQMNVELAGEGEIVLTELERAKATLVLGQDLRGSVLVLEARTGRVIALVDKLDESELSLAVPPGRIAVQVRSSLTNETSAGEFALDWGGQKRVIKSELTKSIALASVARGTSDIDLTPFVLSLMTGASASPFGFPGGTLRLAFERRLLRTPIFLGASLDASFSNRENERWLLRHSLMGAHALVSAEFYLSTLRLFVGADVGASVVSQEGERKNAERIEEVLGDVPVTKASALVPSIFARGGVSLPLLYGFSVQAALRVGTQLVPVELSDEARLTLSPRGDLLVGVSLEF